MRFQTYMNESLQRYSKILLIGSVLIFAVQTLAWANDPTARIVGQVVDQENETPLPDVQVYIRSLNRGDVSDAQGRFEIANLPVGTYDVILKLQGYKTIRKDGIVLTPNETVEVHAVMSVDILVFEDLVVTATRKPESVYEIPQMVSVLDVKQIRDKNLQQTPEALRETAGVVVQKTNQGGGSPIIRGLKANKLLLLVDGIRLNNATYRGGNYQYLNTVSADALQRIEVVHGPNSVLYGSDALGGAVNVITRQPNLRQKEGITVNGSVSGSLSSADRTGATNLSLVASHSRWALLIEGSYRSFGDITRGDNGGQTLMRRLANDSRTDRVLSKTQAPNGYDAYSLSSKLLFKLSEFQDLTFAYQRDRQHDVPRYDVVEALQDSIRLFDPQERDLLYLRFSNTHATTFFNSLQATISVHRQFERRIRQRFGSDIRTVDDIRTLSPGLQVQLNKIWKGNHHLVYGAELYFDQVATRSSSQNTDSSERTLGIPVIPDESSFLNFGMYVQDAFTLGPRWRLHIGGRFSAFRLEAPFDSNISPAIDFGTIEQTSTALTGSLGAQFHLTDAVSLVANLAQGFRTPNLDDVSKVGVGKGSTLFDVPNPDVEPEKSLSLDAGLKVASDRLHANLVGFYNRISDLLIRQPATFNGLPIIVEQGDTLQVVHTENAAEAFTAGFAADAQLRLAHNWLLLANLAFAYGQNVTDSEPLTGVPPLNGLVGVRWSQGRLWMELQGRFAVSQTRLSSEDEEDLRIPEGGTPGWWTLNWRAGWEISENLSLQLGVSNLLDRNYREHLSGFNAPGRNLVVGVRLSY